MTAIEHLNNIFDMTIIEFLNKTFDIKNDVSVPILISLIVFITGGLSTIIFRSITKYFANLRLRNLFRIMLEDIVSQCELKVKTTKKFYPTLTINHNGNWSFGFVTVAYIETVFKLDISLIYNSFLPIFKYRCNKKIRLKAFNKVWSIIENLRFTENRILNDFEKLNTQFNEHESKFNVYSEEFRKYNDNLFQAIIENRFTPEPGVQNDYVTKLDSIVANWQKIENRLTNTNKYEYLFKPIHELNKISQNVSLILPINNIVLPAMHEYHQMTKILSDNKGLFYNLSFPRFFL